MAYEPDTGHLENLIRAAHAIRECDDGEKLGAVAELLRKEIDAEVDRLIKDGLD